MQQLQEPRCAVVGIRIPSEMLRALDRYRQKLGKKRGWRVTRSTAIREIVHEAMEQGNGPCAELTR